jgi:hypothetical protein
MTGDPVQRLLGSPASISVHDDGQMLGEFFFQETVHNKKIKD